MSEEIWSFLEAIELQQRAAHEGTQDAGYVLRTVHSLENCITVLQDIVYNERITGSGRLEELVLLLCRILQRWEHKSFTMEVTSLPQPTPEALTRECIRSGSKGRPFIPINPDQVEFLISVGRSMEEIAQTLLISRRTLYRRCEEFQICKKRGRYSP